MSDARVQRRRAAWAALSTVLDEDSLIDTLWLQHESMGGDSVSDIIAFVDSVGNRHLLDGVTRKRLYGAFFDALRQPEDSLPIDPWPLMIAARPAAAAPTLAPVRAAAEAAAAPWATPAAQPASPERVAVPDPQVALPVAPLASSDGSSSASPATVGDTRELPPHQVVFSTLIGALIEGVRQYHPQELADVLADCRSRIDQARIAPSVRAAARDALVAPTSRAWKLDGTQDQLVALVHQVYVALCEALGPVDADHLLVSAVRQAERLPEARACPPQRFL